MLQPTYPTYIQSCTEGKVHAKKVDDYISKQLFSLNKAHQNELSCSNVYSKTSKTPTNREKPIIANIRDNTITLSTDGKDDLSFKLNIKRVDEQKRFNFLLLLLHNFPVSLSKNELQEKLLITNDQINTACRGINGRLKDDWQFEDYIVRHKSGKLKIKR